MRSMVETLANTLCWLSSIRERPAFVPAGVIFSLDDGEASDVRFQNLARQARNLIQATDRAGRGLMRSQSRKQSTLTLARLIGNCPANLQ